MCLGPTHLIDILKKVFEGITASLRGMETTFDVPIEWCQGEQGFSCISNYYFDYVLKIKTHEIEKYFQMAVEFNSSKKLHNVPQIESNGVSKSLMVYKLFDGFYTQMILYYSV